MSYDLLVFEPSVPPRDRAGFISWYKEQTSWSGEKSALDPAKSSHALQSWYAAMLPWWRNLQDPKLTDDQIDDPHVTDYTFGKDVIYLGFRWSVAEEAYEAVRRLAVDHQVGFYDVSGDEGDGEIHFPGEALRVPSGGTWREVARQFRDMQPK